MDRTHSFSCDSFYMADRMGLDGTMLHYLAVRKALVRVHRPIHSKIMLPYSLTCTWQTDCCTPRRMAFKALLNTKAACSSFLCTYCLNNCQNGLLLKHSYRTVDYRSTMCVGTLMIRLRLIKSSLPFSLPLHPSCDKLFQAPSTSFLYCKRRKAGQGLGTRLSPSGMV